MNSFLKCLVAASLAMNLAACNKQEEVEKAMSVKFDPALKRGERNLLVSDIVKLMSLEVKAAPGSVYPKVFGGSTTSDVVRYLDDRINYIIPDNIDLDARVTAVASLESLKETKVYTIAKNLGTVLWFIQEAARPQKLRFKLGDQLIPLNSSRVGIMQLGEGYTKRAFFSRLTSEIERTGTLVHEARHSDCTGGLAQSDIALIKNGNLPVNKACGHLHATCPVGHPYAGYAACDSHPWGAYAVESVYFSGIATTCKNCKKREINIARMSVLDSLSRVLPLDDMLAGKLGEPNMSSSGVQRRPTPSRTEILEALSSLKGGRAVQPMASHLIAEILPE